MAWNTDTHYIDSVAQPVPQGSWELGTGVVKNIIRFFFTIKFQNAIEMYFGKTLSLKKQFIHLSIDVVLVFKLDFFCSTIQKKS